MDPLTALAAFNAGYAVVKSAAENAGEIGQIFANIGKMLSAKQSIDAQVKPEDDSKSNLELYAIHVEAQEKWDEVKQLLIWTGHWNKYEQFVADRAKQRKEDELKALKERVAKRKQRKDILIIVGGVLATLAIIATFIWAISHAKA